MSDRPSNFSKPLIALVTFSAIVAFLYLGREVFIPIALAILLAFLLSPLVTRLQRFIRNRVAAVSIVTFVTFTGLGGVLYFVGDQLSDLATQIPTYKETIKHKIKSIRSTSSKGTIAKVQEAVKDIGKELNTTQPTTTTATTTVERREERIVYMPPQTSTSDDLWGRVGSLIPSLASPLATAGIVILLVIMMLISREDIRDRSLRLMGDYNLPVTTQALDEVGLRISRYLLMQLTVNVIYGVVIGMGLFFINLPNPILWGLLAIILRFIPYIGPWIAASFPILLSIAVSEQWTMLFMVLGLFVVAELVTNMVLEPILYGSSTGISPIGVVVTVIFWTWLWGAAGLLLAVPITVCIVVLAKYLPGLGAVTLLLAEKSPLSPETRLYHRLLSGDEPSADDLVDEEKKELKYIEINDQIILPSLTLAKRDSLRKAIDDERIHTISDIVRGLLLDLPPPKGQPRQGPVERLAILPLRDELDETAASVLAPILQADGFDAQVLSHKRFAGEAVDELIEAGARVVCISAVLPSSLAHLRRLCNMIRQRCGDVRIVAGLWGDQALRNELAENPAEKLPDVRVVHTLEQASNVLREFIESQPTTEVAASN